MKAAYFGAATAFTAGLLLIFFSREISDYLTPTEQANVQKTSALIGHVTALSGKVWVRPSEAVKESGTAVGYQLQHLDQTRTETSSFIDVTLNSGWQLKLHENTTVIFESYRPGQNNAPILMSLLRGQYTVSAAGPAGQLFVQQGKKIFTPQNAPEALPPKITITAPDNTDDTSITEPTEITDSADILSAANPKKKNAMPDKLPVGHEETLSSQYIESVLAQEANSFRRCQLNNIRDNRPSFGNLLVSLTIEPNGSIANSRVLQDEIQNEVLSQCVLSALARVKFKAFQGLPITLTYPIEFK